MYSEDISKVTGTKPDSIGKKIRMGVLGGGFGPAFEWHKHPNADVQAVCDARPMRLESLAQK